MEQDGFLVRDIQTRRYRLSAKVMSLGFEFLSAQPFTDAAQAYLGKVSDETRATAFLVVIDGWEVVHLARMAPSAALVMNLQIGARFPVHSVVSGRAILSYLDEANLQTIHASLRSQCKTVAVPDFQTLREQARTDRARGYVLSRSLYEPSISACAAPIRDRTGAAVAAITVVAPHSFVDELGGEEALSRIVTGATNSFPSNLGFRQTHRILHRIPPPDRRPPSKHL